MVHRRCRRVSLAVAAFLAAYVVTYPILALSHHLPSPTPPFPSPTRAGRISAPVDPREAPATPGASPSTPARKPKGSCAGGGVAEAEALGDEYPLPGGAWRLFNPSPLAPWASPLPPGLPAVVLYRAATWSGSLVLFRSRPMPSEASGPAEASQTSQALGLPALASQAAPNASHGQFAHAELVDAAAGNCRYPNEGFEDGRALLAGREVVVVTNAMHPRPSCERAIAVATFDLGDVLRQTSAEPAGAERAVRATSLTYLVRPEGYERLRQEKNWMPFFADDAEPAGAGADVAARLRYVRYIEPHQVVACDGPALRDVVEGKRGENRTVTRRQCRVVAETSWPELPRLVGARQQLRGSSVVVDRGPGEDLLALGHFKTASYAFFWYTFARRAPYAITGASRHFELPGGPAQQPYASGVARVGDWYHITYSVDDTGSHSYWVPACDVHRRVREILPPRPAQQASAL
eukprot:m51a1_g5842 hypothetical protein (464) ;mRNA; r:312268-313659